VSLSQRKPLIAADLFCGAGGTSTGLIRAAKSLGYADDDIDLLAINHWDVAIQTHSANHPGTRHKCESLDNVDPRKAFPGGRLDLLVASPECTHHANARGGKPMSDQSRASAWHVCRWAESLYIDTLIVENVREFQTWGPIGADGRPLKSKRGQTFHAWLKALESLGYKVDYRVLNAADYGGATTRERLFVMAHRGNRKPAWPEPTHGQNAALQRGLFGQRLPWKPARDVIDWSLAGESIFRRKKPLARTTLERIAAGLRKFGGRSAEPFLVILRRHMDASSLSEPMPTVTAGGTHIALCEPFLVNAGGPEGQGRNARSIDDPLATILTDNHMGICEPFLMNLNRAQDGPVTVDEPIRTITATSSDFAMVEPFIAELRGGKSANSISEPLSTVTTKGAHHALIEPFVIPLNHGAGDVRTHSIGEPLPTITTVDAWALIEAGKAVLDIRFRMLQPHELASAMGFDRNYRFAGNREARVKQIGNAVHVDVAEALCREALRPAAERRNAA